MKERNITKRQREKAARVAALQVARLLLWKEYCGPTLKFENVDQDALREAILDLHIQLDNRLLRAVGDNYPETPDDIGA